MITKKHILVAVLITFCMTFVLFGIAPTKSANNPYDAWLDTNDDGTINMRDIGAECSAFGATGDPAKSVTITGHANKLAYSIENQPIAAMGYFLSPIISVDGYSKMTVCTSYYSPPSSFNDYLLFARHFNSSSFFIIDTQTNITDFAKTYDVPNQEIVIEFWNNGATQSNVWIDVYLIP